MQIGRGSKLRIAELAPVRRGNDPLGHAERSGVGAKPFCGKLNKDAAHLRAGKPQRDAAVLDRFPSAIDARERIRRRRRIGSLLHGGWISGLCGKDDV